MSCSTNASRSAGASVSSTTSSASPTESASSASCSGSPPSRAAGDRVGRRARRAAPRAAIARERSMFRHTRATTVVSQPPRFSTAVGVGAAQAQPGLLDGVVGLAHRAEHPVRHRRAAASGAPRTARPASSCRPSVTFLPRRVSSQVDPATLADVTGRSVQRTDRETIMTSPILVTGGTGTLGPPRRTAAAGRRPRGAGAQPARREPPATASST